MIVLLSDWLGVIIVGGPFAVFLVIMLIGATIEVWDEGFRRYLPKFSSSGTITDKDNHVRPEYPVGRFDKQIAGRQESRGISESGRAA